MTIFDYGWNEYFEKEFIEYKEKGYIPARIITQQKNYFGIVCDEGEFPAKISGRMEYDNFLEARDRSEFPGVGDWVPITLNKEAGIAMIHNVVSRKNMLSRKMINSEGRASYRAGTSAVQVIGSNIDVIFLVAALDRDFNTKKIERYLTLIYESGSKPVIVLNKADLCEDVETFTAQLESFEVPIHVMSGLENDNVDVLYQYISHGITIAFIGSSGVGKSTIINCLIGAEKQYVNTTRQGDGRGRHTTTHRELILLKKGGVIMDNPGLKDIQLLGEEENLKKTFADIEELANECKFRDCRHRSEPGCAVKKALEEGRITRKHYSSYIQQKGELKSSMDRIKLRIKLGETVRKKRVKKDKDNKHKELQKKKRRREPAKYEYNDGMYF